MLKSKENKIWFVVIVVVVRCFAIVDTALAQEKSDLSIPVAIGNGESAIARQAKTRSVSHSSKTTQWPAAQRVALAGAKKTLKRIKPNRWVRRTAKFANAEIVLTDQFSLEYISTLPRAPGSDLKVLDGHKRVIVQLPAREVKALVDEGAEVTVQRKFVLIEGFVDEASSREGDITALQTCSGPYVEGSSSTNVPIPDDGSGWAYSDIYISTAPVDATVTCIDVHYEIIHTYVGDLVVDLSDEDLSYEYRLWENEGGSTDDITETETGITAFNGEWVNQIWTLWALDNFPFADDGYIDYWWIKVYYADEGYDYYIQADSYFENTVEVPFGFSDNPGTVYFSRLPECGSVDPNYDEPEYDDETGLYWVRTEYNPCENECSSVTITADPTVGPDQTKTVHVDDRRHIGCGSPEELCVTTYDTDTGEPAEAFVTVTVIPPEAGIVNPPSGNSQWNPNYGLYVFCSTYTPSCSYAGRVRVKFQTSASIIIFSFDQNIETLIPCSNLQTVCESFCTEGVDINYYQVYKMYLYGGENYDFSLCDNDGVEASCDGDGDLEMFNNTGTSLWYIDGASDCDWDASTLGTQYEGWSPPSDGYYHLKVSEYSYAPMSYCLAYWGSGTLGDFDSNGTVNFSDFAILGNQWRQPPGIPPADIAPEVPDGFVDMLDLAVFVENWLEAAAP